MTTEVTKKDSKAVEIVLTADQFRRVKKIKSYHAAFLKSFKQQMGYTFLAGMELEGLKVSLPHGKFEDACAAHFPGFHERTLRRHHKFFTELKELKPPGGKTDIVSLLASPDVVSAKGKLTKDGQAAVLKAVYEIADGKSLTQMYRDLGVIREPQKDGGFRPNAEAVQKWLKENHPELLGTKYNDLPPAIQKAFKKQYFPEVDPAAADKLQCEDWMNSIKDLLRMIDDKVHLKLDEKQKAQSNEAITDIRTALLAVTKEKKK